MVSKPHAKDSPNGRSGNENTPLLICFSHLRWDFVLQRPQHVMSRLAAHYRVIFWQEALSTDGAPALRRETCPASGVTIVTPLLPEALAGAQRDAAKRALLDQLTGGCVDVAWYYTPMTVPLSRHLQRAATVYDCMDELSGFLGAPPELADLEQELLARADVVFTGGQSLFDAKRALHDNIHCFPSAVDVAHFGRARAAPPTGEPIFGYFGVIDERLDLHLVSAVARARPDWTIEMVGPVAKIDAANLPRLPNLRWVGQQPYGDLPRWLARWSVALMPFAHNSATRFISPTKAPEYLAGGRPVVSTGIADVRSRFDGIDGVAIADTASTFVAACEAQLLRSVTSDWLDPVDAFLARSSWTATVDAMRRELVRRTAPLPQTHYDVVVVGAGFAGAVMAERFAADAGKSVLVIDRRPHIAGNAFDRRNEAGVLIHEYGPHIFHTNSDEVFGYLSRFTAWRPYEHRVLASVRGKLVPMPINRTTLNELFDLDLGSDAEAAAYLAGRAEPVQVIRTSEDVVVDKVGRELYELFFQGYTRKQWGLDPSELDKSVTARVPTRVSDDDRYFTDTHQAMPLHGYTKMFEAMLRHPNIAVRLGEDFAEVRDQLSWDRLVFTGPIDEFFDHRFGALPYRSLRFDHETLPVAQAQPVATINYPDAEVPFTRITEYRHLTGETGDVTSITREYPSATGDPYYPIPQAANQVLYQRYRELADASDTIFVGRLASYRYYNMDQVVGQALAAYRRVRERDVFDDVAVVETASA